MAKKKEKEQVTEVEIGSLTPNEENPRYIRSNRFDKLVKSLKEFPEMSEVRPIVANTEGLILGGNMRYEAMKHAGWKKVPVVYVDWSEKKQKEFIIKDNVGFGSFDWDVLANEWSPEQIEDWGLEIPTIDDNSNLFEIEYDTKEKSPSEKADPSARRITNDDYSKFELIMLHENKLKLIDKLDEIRREKGIERQEDAIMELVLSYTL